MARIRHFEQARRTWTLVTSGTVGVLVALAIACSDAPTNTAPTPAPRTPTNATPNASPPIENAGNASPRHVPDNGASPLNNTPRANAHAGGNRPQSRPQTPVTPRTVGPFTLAFSNETQCWFLPCGCREGMSGGHPRRATVLARFPKHRRLVVDLGDVACGTGETSRHIFGYTLAGLKQMGYDAFTVGREELDVARVAGLSLPKSEPGNAGWISANVAITTNGTALEPFRVFTRDGVRFGVTAVTAPSLAQGLPPSPTAGIAKSPAEALAAIWPRLAEACDVAVLLAKVPEADARALAKQFPGFAFVLVGGPPSDGRPRNQPPEGLGKNGGAPYLARVGDRGRFQGTITFSVERPASARASVTNVAAAFIELDGSIKDDRGMLELIERMRIAWPRAEAGVRLADNLYTGYLSCFGCHDEAIKVWEKSAHAHAFETLEKTKRAKNAETNPRCLQCHSLGFNEPQFGGYTNIYDVPEILRGVTCGHCHGRASTHADPNEGGKKDKGKTLTIQNPRDVCVHCHDAQNDPDFDFDKAWAKIKH